MKNLRTHFIGTDPLTAYRVAVVTFWRTFHFDGKIIPSPILVRVGVHAYPISLHLALRTKLWRTLQLRGQIHSPYFYATSICTQWIYQPLFDLAGKYTV